MEIVRNEREMACTPEPLLMRYEIRTDGKPILPVQQIKLGIIANILISILRYAPKFKDCIHSLLIYAKRFDENYFVCYVKVRIVNIDNSITSSMFLAAECKEAHKPNITVS